MRVHVHTKFCFLCLFTLLFHQCTHCHESGHHHHHHHHHHQHSNDHDHGHDHDHVHDDHQISREPYVGPPIHLIPGNQKGAAEQEQHYYIQELFRRYGQQDRLDFHGFQNLLLSLGLGKVRVVELDHENLGHDHVAHLDLLEVQEGLHSHSPGHPHSHHSHHDHNHHSHGETNGSSCSPNLTAAVGPTVESKSHGRSGKDGDHDHDHDHEQDQHVGDHKHEHGSTQTRSVVYDHTHNNHEHSHGHSHDHDHEQDITQTETPDHDHTQDSLEHSHVHLHNHTKEQTSEQTQETNDLTGPSLDHSSHEDKTQPHHHGHHHHKHPHPHHYHHTPDTVTNRNSTQNTSASLQISNSEALSLQPSSQPPNSTSKRIRRPQRGKGQRGRSRTPNPTDSTVVADGADEHEHDHDHDHDHHVHQQGQSSKEKRAVPAEMGNPNTSSASRFEDGPHLHEECLNLTQLLHHYGLSPDSLISPAQFTYLCPALLYQIDSRLCIRHYHQVDIQEAPPTSAWVWVCGFVSITVISLLSLLGVVLVPILNQSCFKFLLTFLVALAVGTLSGDALLHLLPHSQGTHDHGQSEHELGEESVDLLTEFDGVWKGLTALAGIYLLFIIEHCITMIKHYKDQGGSFFQRRKRGKDAKIGKKLSDHKLNRRSDAEWMHLQRLDEASQSATPMMEEQPSDSPSKTPLAITDTDTDHPVDSEGNSKKAKTKKHGHGHSHHDHCHSEKDMKDAGIASIAWMVIMGDGMHNFSDGLAIGAAFSANITGGISTSVAVFCHELPHELGDFAVLLKAGMTVKQAIVYNLLSALMAYFGMLIGTAVGQYAHNVTSWIFAVTAGMFLYVALVDMLPEMLHGDSEEHKRCQLGHFVLQNVGMLTGFAIMLLIAIFEDRIVFDFDF
ncbi:zinc transporter ZIP10 [Tachysurus fulvidraco]|uniref:zinc transporter ZIP10 n=1 Tax=Tachysurus fulvidraco TaxID=1234273 RepID=UPI001FEF861C|nr:zinc transporter ZIP10 [Tachysurus fulvidraco]XP_027008266.2 zinc transporter ZIP10 [Tachysurus fulvidraco]XP_027008267.2 zinc transporter ZIP10 [Tachysurus fulvidraco]XP_027008268.2 zinc transporter ZIP10 [Tachysurus fulvidraco]XP_027008269.2 zinc transporter ZIP10 [Tachysurus fulvidraco]